MRFCIVLQTTRRRFVLFGAIAVFYEDEINLYPDPYVRTIVAFIPPQKWREGVEFKMWGYDRTSRGLESDI